MDTLDEIFLREAKALTQELGRKLDRGPSFGSFSPSIYDTAWLSRVRTPGSQPEWLFPQCFEYLLQAQEPDGGWPAYASEMDGILATMAALIALREHQSHLQPEVNNSSVPTVLEKRILRAEESLTQMLHKWDVLSTVHVGFEMLVPALLDELEKGGAKFEFPGRGTLMSLNQRKLRKLRPELVYGQEKTTLVHSLEALVGKIDFDRVSHHLDEHGSMLASPAATAAYLMHRSKWDPAAEEYLRTAVAFGSGAGGGGVPGAFPSSIFEVAWIISTLLKARPSPEILALPEAAKVGVFLRSQLDLHCGIVGFAPGVLEDADDTAKTILSLNLLGFPASPRRLVDEFEMPEHFRTYRYELNGSFSANCNVLDALLHCPDSASYRSQIARTARFLCREFNGGNMRDKWNLSDGYSMMLLSQALTGLLQSWDSGLLEGLPDDLIREQLPIVLSQILFRTLQTQSSDGSWCFNNKASREVTAYAVLTLKSLFSLPWLAYFQPRVRTAIKRGSAYLVLSHDLWSHDEHLWVAKVTYALPSVARAYNTAALYAQVSHSWGGQAKNLITLPVERVRNLASFCSSLPMFCEDQLGVLEGDVVLGYLYQAYLARLSSNIMPPQSKGANMYLEYIPFTWIATNRRNHYSLSNTALWELMVISVLIYRLDECMEAVCGGNAGAPLTEPLRRTVRELCEFDAQGSASPNRTPSNRIAKEVGNGPGNGGQDIVKRARDTLHCFTSHILEHPAVLQSPTRVRKQLHSELVTCLLAHIDHEEDHARFTAQQLEYELNNPSSESSKGSSATLPFASPRGTYYSWVRTTSADNTQAPVAFLFFCCLVAPPGEPFFRGVRQHYLSGGLSRHLAALCRQYNDYGSASRDKAEGSLNSLNFPEFYESCGEWQESQAERARGDDEIKAELFFIAEYERECLNHALAKLSAELGDKQTNVLRVFVDTVDLYGQIYVARDISNWSQ